MFPKSFNSSFCNWRLSSYRVEEGNQTCEMVSFSSWHSNTLIGKTFGKLLCDIASLYLNKYVGKQIQKKD